MHGGADGSGAPKGNRNAWKHGERSQEVVMRRREGRKAVRYLNLIARIVGRVKD
jgi:hypothetical protein